MINVSNYGYNKRFAADEYNLNRKRNQLNTRTTAYNCGGFAFGIFSWYYPYDVDILDYAYNNNFISKTEKEFIESKISEEKYLDEEDDFLMDFDGNEYRFSTIPVYSSWAAIKCINGLEFFNSHIFYKDSPYMDYYTSKMLSDIKGIRKINDLSELKENEYCVAFRVGDGDFHYIRSNNSKCTTWISKCGRNSVKKLSDWEKTETIEDMFDQLFGWRYTSKTILFAKEIDKYARYTSFKKT